MLIIHICRYNKSVEYEYFKIFYVYFICPNLILQCLVVNYYVSCDVQFFIVGGIIVYVYTKNTKYGIRLLATILSLSAFVPFLVTILTKRFGIDMLYLP